MPNQNSSHSISTSNQKQRVGSSNSSKISHDTHIQSGSIDVFNSSMDIEENIDDNFVLPKSKKSSKRNLSLAETSGN